MVLVMMRPMVVPPRDTECMNVPGGPQTEEFFAKDLPSAIRSHYRVGRPRGELGHHRRLHGRLLRPEAGAPEDPARTRRRSACRRTTRCPEDRTTGDLFGGSSGRTAGERPAVAAAAPAAARGEPAGDQQPARARSNYKATEHFIGLVKGPTRVSSIILPDGGHNFTTWGREVPAAMRWLSQQLVPDPPPTAANAALTPGR